MSFNFGPLNNLTNVQASAKSCPGGGGNTGYFKRGERDEDDAMLGFKKDMPEDSFTKVNLEDFEKEEVSIGFFKKLKRLYVKLIVKIRRFFKKRAKN